MHGLEFKRGGIQQFVLFKKAFDVFIIVAQLLEVDPAALVRKTVEPLPAAPEHFQRAAEITALDMVIADAYLEDAAIKLADRPFFCPPGAFKLFVSLEIMPGVEQLQPFEHVGRERMLKIKRDFHFVMAVLGFSSIRYHSSYYIGKMGRWEGIRDRGLGIGQLGC